MPQWPPRADASISFICQHWAPPRTRFSRRYKISGVDGARVYLGAIHHMHPADGLRRQLQAARKYLPQFGIAAPCGFGRLPERPGRF